MFFDNFHCKHIGDEKHFISAEFHVIIKQNFYFV